MCSRWRERRQSVDIAIGYPVDYAVKPSLAAEYGDVEYGAGHHHPSRQAGSRRRVTDHVAVSGASLLA